MFFQLLLAIACLVRGGVSECPPADPVQPCSCRTLLDIDENEYSVLNCHGLQSEDDLQTILVETREYILYELEFTGCSLGFLPQDTFDNTTFEVLSLRDSNITSLSDSNTAFFGVRNKLRMIEIINCNYTGGWEWTQLSQLQSLTEIHVIESQLADITEGLFDIQHLHVEAFGFQKNRIDVVADDVFASFHDLERLYLDNNDISMLKRSMLPNPAKYMTILGLSYNKLADLPQDLFYEMPALKSLYLTGNPLYTIHEPTFRPVWEQLHLILFHTTHLSCDCSIAWLVRKDNHDKFIHANCAAPPNLKGRLLDSLQLQELYGYESSCCE